MSAVMERCPSFASVSSLEDEDIYEDRLSSVESLELPASVDENNNAKPPEEATAKPEAEPQQQQNEVAATPPSTTRTSKSAAKPKSVVKKVSNQVSTSRNPAKKVTATRKGVLSPNSTRKTGVVSPPASRKTSVTSPPASRKSSVLSPNNNSRTKRTGVLSPNSARSSTTTRSRSNSATKRPTAASKTSTTTRPPPIVTKTNTIGIQTIEVQSTTTSSVDSAQVAEFKKQIHDLETKNFKLETLALASSTGSPTNAGELSSAVEGVVKETERKWHLRLNEQTAEHEAQVKQVRSEYEDAITTSASQVEALRLENETVQQKAAKDVENLQHENKVLIMELASCNEDLETYKTRITDFEADKERSASTFWQKTTDLAKRNHELEDAAHHHKNEVLKLEEANESLKHDINVLKQQKHVDHHPATNNSAALQKELSSTKTSLEEECRIRKTKEIKLEEMQTENTALYAELMAVKTSAANAALEQHSKLFEEKLELANQLIELKEENSRLLLSRNTSTTSADQQPMMGNSTDTTLVVNSSAMDNCLSQELQKSRKLVTDQKSQLELLEAKLLESESIRRKMHNKIQELRGNVRVNVRVRPFLTGDNVGEDAVPSTVLDPLGYTVKLRDHTFGFDKIFGQTAGQEQVFEEVSEFIQSALDGYNVCIFAYGQTGSGKTHSMQGSGTGHMRGIIPRSIEQIMSSCKNLSSSGWEFALEVSYLEIYNDSIRDLLKSSDAPLSPTKLAMRTDKRGQNYVDGAERVTVEDESMVEALMEQAACNRSVACTDMNSQSSRSHSIFTLYITGVNATQGTELHGSLNLVDLAGSERLSRSNATGERLKEAQAINKSLSALADVFIAIGKGDPHIPYRNSKLTQVLQPALFGDGKALMMVNLSPTEESYNETLCSLRFAKQVGQCELGAPTRQLKKKKQAPSH